MRPGNLARIRTQMPRALRTRGLGDYSTGLGAFGKGAFIPLPGTPTTPANLVASKTGVDITTGKYYMQDPACPDGESISTQNIACKGDECCDAPGDCDPEGTVYAETDCYIDPKFLKLPDPPEGGFQSCQEWDLFGYPKGECNKESCPSCFAVKPPTLQQQKPQAAPKPANVSNRSPLALPFTGSCPRTHFKDKDAMGDYCKPCPPGSLFNAGTNKCEPKPPACPCGLPRQGDPDFGKCPTPPSGCGPAPQHQKCNVPGYGPKNLVCKCGRWQCPTPKDLLIEKFKREGKAIPQGVAGYSFGEGYKKPLMGVVIVAIAIIAGYLLLK